LRNHVPRQTKEELFLLAAKKGPRALAPRKGRRPRAAAAEVAIWIEVAAASEAEQADEVAVAGEEQGRVA